MTSFYLEFINIFAGKMAYDVFYRNNDLIKFRVKIVNTNENYCFVDSTWSTDLLSEKQFTDVDIFVGQNKLQAQQVVLSARSPVFKTLLSKISKQ